MICKGELVCVLTFAQLSGCQHVFHVKCLVQLQDQRCPACREDFVRLITPDGTDHPYDMASWEIYDIAGNCRRADGNKTPTAELENMTMADESRDEAKNDTEPIRRGSPTPSSTPSSSSSSSSSTHSSASSTTRSTTAPARPAAAHVPVDREHLADFNIGSLNTIVNLLDTFVSRLFTRQQVGEKPLVKRLSSESTATTYGNKLDADFETFKSNVFKVRGSLVKLITSCKALAAGNNALSIFAQESGERDAALARLEELEEEDRRRDDEREALSQLLGKASKKRSRH